MKEFKEKINAILVVLLIISLWINYSNYNQLRNLQNDLNRTSSMLENRINDINRNVSNTLNNFKKESMWVRESSFDIIGFTDNLKEATLQITIDLNEKNKDEKLYVIANSIKREGKLEFELPESNDLTYRLEITLPVEEYEIQLLGENNGNMRSDLLNRIDLSSYKNSIITIDAQMLGGVYAEKEQEGFYSFFVAVNQMKKSEEMFVNYLEDLEITEIKADVYLNDSYMNTIDFLKGTNYVPMDIKDMGNKIPEMAVTNDRIEFEQKHFFSGRYEIKGKHDFSGILFHIQVKDNKGNTYHEFMGNGPYDYDKMMKEKRVQ